MAQNIFLDGNSFQESRSVAKRILVGSLQAGATVRYGRFGLTYAQTLQTPEHRGQKSMTNYGSVRLSLQF